MNKWWRAPVTILGTMLVVVAEFGLLAAVYERAAPVRTARVVVGSLQGELAAPGQTPAVLARDTAAAHARLRSLGEVGRRASSAVRSGDTVARLGGDKFAILIEDADIPVARSIAQKLLSCSERSAMTSSSCTFSRRSISGPGSSPASKHWCDGSIRNAA